MWQELMEWVDRRIAQRLRDIGVIGDSINARVLVGSVPDEVLPPWTEMPWEVGYSRVGGSDIVS